MKKLYDVHKDFRSALLLTTPTNWIAVHWINLIYKLGWYLYNKHKEVKVTGYKIKSSDGKKIKVHVYEPPVTLSHNPCMLYYHGGGFMLSISPRTRRRMERYAIEVGCIVVLVDYRLMPRYRYPKAIEDAYSALMWIVDQADGLKIDVNKLAVAGDSAGGFLASVVAHKAAEEERVNICMQILLYPVIDYRIKSESMQKYTDTPIWNAKKNKEMWNKFLRDVSKENNFLCPLDYPISDKHPRTYIEVAQFDCLHDEGIIYGQKLRSADVEVDISDVKGGIHGYDNFEYSHLVQELMKKRVYILRKVFNECES